MKKVTIPRIIAKKHKGQRLSMLTAYDATFARLVDEARVDMILVGDSVGMVVQGHDSTLAVTMDDMVYHTRAVCRGRQRALVVADLPFGSYQACAEDALRNSARLLAQGGAEAVKLEGGRTQVDTVRKLVDAGIPVMGHIGLTPQSVHALGGFVMQGKTNAAAQALLEDARLLEQAGCFSLVLESIPAQVAKTVTASLRIPTIGIGAGVGCDGQVLVIYDLLGLNPDFKPRFVKRYAELGEIAREAASRFVSEVTSGDFPGEEHTFYSKNLGHLPDSARSDDDEAEVLELYSAPI